MSIPIFTRTDLPGGPWRVFVRKARVAAVRVLGEFQFTDTTGTTTDYPNGGWVVQHPDGTVEVIDPTTFAGTYDADGSV